MKSILILAGLLLVSCQREPEAEKEYVTPAEKEVLDEMSKSYKKN